MNGAPAKPFGLSNPTFIRLALFRYYENCVVRPATSQFKRCVPP
jgi:hypothetical protein